MKLKANEQVVEISFPFKGWQTALSRSKESPVTSPYIANSRIKDAKENRAGGGQRCGVKKAFTTQVGDDKPVVKMVQIITTYIPPET